MIGSAHLSLIPYGKVCDYRDYRGELPATRTFTDLGTPALLIGLASGLTLVLMIAPAVASRLRNPTI